MTRGDELAFSLVLLTFSASVLVSHRIGDLYPAVTIALIIGVVAVLIVLATTNLQPKLAVYLLAALGAAHRLWLYTFPASMMRFDPDAYAVRSQVIVNTGGLDATVEGFYHVAAAFPVTGSITSLLTGLNIEASYAIFPLTIGLLLPLFAAAIARRLIFTKTVGPVAAAIVAVGAPSTLYSIAPIPITLAAIYLVGGVLIAALAPDRLHVEWILPLMVFGVAAAATHKISLLVFAGITVVFVVYTTGLRGLNFNVRQQYGFILVCITGLLLIVQWVYATSYVSDAVFQIAAVAGVSVSGSEIPHVVAAERLTTPLLFSLINNLYYPLVLVVGGVAGLLLLREYRQRNIRLIQAAAAVTVAFTAPSAVLGRGPGFQRIYIYGSVFVAALIATAVSRVGWEDSRWRSTLATIAVVAIVVANPLSMIATPDHPGSPREYLTPAEVEGKTFTNQYTNDVVYRDVMYGDEVVDFEAAARGDDWHQGQVPNPWDPGLLSSELLQGTLPDKGYEKVSLRTSVDVWRLRGGWYRLKWEPEKVLDRSYNRIYANGEVVTYDKS